MPDILGKLCLFDFHRYFIHVEISASQLGALHTDIKLAVYILPELFFRDRRDRRQLVFVASERHLPHCDALAVLVLIVVDLVWCFFWCFALVLVRVDDVASCKFIHRTEVCLSWPRYNGSCPWQCEVLLIAQSIICVKGSVPFGVSSSNSLRCVVHGTPRGNSHLLFTVFFSSHLKHAGTNHSKAVRCSQLEVKFSLFL